jgi:hypothetical protein
MMGERKREKVWEVEGETGGGEDREGESEQAG